MRMENPTGSQSVFGEYLGKPTRTFVLRHLQTSPVSPLMLR